MKIFLIIYFTIASVILVDGQQVARYITTENGQGIGFLEARPTGYGKQKHPVIIFLHGSDERGNGKSELINVARQGIPKITSKKTLAFNGSSFIVLSPQLEKKYGDWPPFYIDEMIRYAKTLSADTNRIYLTGLSLGGGGVWAYASNNKNAVSLAAIVPVCGVCFYDYQKLSNIAKINIPVWGLVGQKDKVVNPICTIQAVDAVNAAAPAVPAKKTVYKGVGHNAWDRAYDPTHKYQSPNVYEWMLKFSRKKT